MFEFVKWLYNFTYRLKTSLGQCHLAALNGLTSLEIKGISLIDHLLRLPFADDVPGARPFDRLE